jgi:hypothetical protein
MPTATLDFKPEGLRAIEFSFSGPASDVFLTGFNISEAQIEPLLKYSALLPGMRDLPAQRVESKRRRVKLPWKKAPALYQVTPLLTIALTTTALAFPRLAKASEFTGVVQTPIYHFDRSQHGEAVAATDDTVTAQQIRALDELLALSTGPEQDIHIDDWA